MRGSTSPWVTRRALMGLVLILGLAAALRMVVFRGYVGLDDAEYARFAHHLAHGTHVNGYRGPAVFPLRVGVTVPTALSFRLLGESERTMVLYPFVVSMLYVVVVYVCAALLFGWQSGLIAAGLAAIFPWDVDCATKLLPDPPGALFQAVAVTALVAVNRTRPTGRLSLAAAGAFAGVALGLAWLSKESVSYLAPFCAILLVMTVRREGSRHVWLWAGVAAGAGLILGAEIASYYRMTGDPLFRAHEIERNYRQWPNGFFTEGSDFGWQPGQSYGRALFDRLFVAGPAMFFLDRSMLFLPLIGLVTTVYAWWRRDDAFVIPALWLWTLVLMFNFSSSSMTTYTPLALFQRYLYPIFAPSIVLVAGFLGRLQFPSDQAGAVRARPHRWAAAGTALFILWAAAPNLYYSVRTPPDWWLAEARQHRATVHPDTTLYSDTLTLRAFEFFNGYPDAPAWTDFADIQSAADIPQGSLVLVNNQYIQWLDKNAGMWLSWPLPELSDTTGYRKHAFYDTPPVGWRRLWANHNASLYRVETSALATSREDSGRQ